MSDDQLKLMQHKLDVLRTAMPNLGQEQVHAIKRVMTADPALTYHDAAQLVKRALQPEPLETTPTSKRGYVLISKKTLTWLLRQVGFQHLSDREADKLRHIKETL